MRLSAAGLGATLGLALACAPVESPAPDALAVFRNGLVTYSDLEAHITALPVEARRPADGDFAAWYERLARDLALERILVEEARREGPEEDPELQDAWAEVERQVVVGRFLEQRLPQLPPVRLEEVHAYYDEHRDEFGRQEQRQVFHIFKRRGAGGDDTAARAAIEALRERVLAGEDFSVVAAESSDSESRHRRGLIGSARRGELPPELEEIVFALEPREVSAAVATKDGFHLFWVESAIEAKSFSFEEVRTVIGTRLRQQRYAEAVKRLELEGEVPAGSFLPEPEELRALATSDDDQALLLRIGAYELRRADLTRRLGPAAEGGLPPALVLQAVTEARQRELLYLRAVEEGVEDDPEVLARLAAARESQLAAFRFRERLHQFIDERPAELEQYYADNRKRYSEPLRLRLERLQVPLGQQPAARMAELERSSAALNAGEGSLEEVAARLGGTVETLDWRTLDRLRREQPTLATLVHGLAAGECSAPYRTREQLEMARVIERRDPQVLPFERAREAVRRDLVRDHGERLTAETIDTILAEHHYQPRPEQLQAAATRIAGKPQNPP